MNKTKQTGLGKLSDWAICAAAITGYTRRLPRFDDTPIRMHVVGDSNRRGHVTRLIAAGLRAGNVTTVAKTNAGCPSLILPDGQTDVLKRTAWQSRPRRTHARMRMVEQAQAMRVARQRRADALVLESLGDSVRGCEARVVRPTHVVRCNADDELAGSAVGPTVSLTLTGTVAPTTRQWRRTGPSRAQKADLRDQRSTTAHAPVKITVTEDHVAAINWDDLVRFPYIKCPQNIALALRACVYLGVDPQVAILGMQGVSPAPGATTVYHVRDQDDWPTSTVLVNGFATYDEQTTQAMWRMARARYGQGRQSLAIVHCRHDHADRARQLATACASTDLAEHYLLVGDTTKSFVHTAAGQGINSQQMTVLKDASVDDICKRVRQLSCRNAFLMGLGSYTGIGFELVKRFRHASVRTDGPALSATNGNRRQVAA